MKKYIGLISGDDMERLSNGKEGDDIVKEKKCDVFKHKKKRSTCLKTLFDSKIIHTSKSIVNDCILSSYNKNISSIRQLSSYRTLSMSSIIKPKNDMNDYVCAINEFIILLKNEQLIQYLLVKQPSKNIENIILYHFNHIYNNTFSLTKQTFHSDNNKEMTRSSNNPFIKEESEKRLLEYDKCFQICFDILNELREYHFPKPNSNSKSNKECNVNQININLCVSVSNIFSMPLFTRKDVCLTNKYHNSINEEDCSVNISKMYDFKVSKPENGILIKCCNKRKNTLRRKYNILMENYNANISTSDIQINDDDVDDNCSNSHNNKSQHHFPYHISKKNFGFKFDKEN